MTVPITPGPFSFLAPAGEAAGNILEGRRTRQLQDQVKNRQDLQDYLHLVEAGVFPRSSLTTPAVASLFQRAGVPLPGGMQPVPSTEERKANVLAAAPPDVFAASQGIPSPTAVAAKEKTDQAAGIAAGIKTSELAGVTPGTPQARAVAGVPGAQQAAAAEGQKTAQAEVDQKILKEVGDKMDTDPEFARWAAIAKADFLPLYLHRIQAYASLRTGENAERRVRMQLLFQPLEDAARTFREQQGKYKQDLSDLNANLDAMQADDATRQKALEDFKNTNPEPSQKTIRAHAIVNMARDLFSSLPDDQSRVAAYWAELRRTTGILSQDLPQGRLDAIKKAADLVRSTANLKDGDPKKVTADMARRRIIQTAKDPSLELLELERMLNEEEDKKKND